MKIVLTPISQKQSLAADIEGDILYLNGKSLDLSELAEGDVLPITAIETDWLAGPVFREDGLIHVNLVLPHGPQAAHTTRFPAPLELENGPISLPAFCSGVSPEPEMETGLIEVDWDQRQTAQDRREANTAALQALAADAAKAYLRETDWYITRQIETGNKIPDAVVEQRRIARSNANSA